MTDDDFADIEAIMAKLPPISIEDIRRAQREAEQAPWPPPSVIPQPEFVRVGPFQSVARFRCPHGCGWWHDEPTDTGPGPLIIPVDDIEGTITLDAELRGLALYDRIEQAITHHYAEHHAASGEQPGPRSTP